MDFKAQDFDSKISPLLNEHLNFLFEKGYKLTLVGGAIRDYFLFGVIGNDLDFEIRHNDENILNNWEDQLLTDFKDFERLPFNIFRLSKDFLEIEISSPRKETYRSDLGHSNFDAHFDGQMTYHDSFSRRDLTCNAIGIEISKTNNDFTYKLIDPYSGVKGLSEKLLYPVSNAFTKDPVRFLRLIRFSLNFNFDFSKDVLDSLKDFNLSKLSNFYFFKEFFKTKNRKVFFKTFYKLIDNNGIVVNDSLLKLRVLEKIESFKDISDEIDLMEAILDFISLEDVDLYLKEFNLKRKVYAPIFKVKILERNLDDKDLKDLISRVNSLKVDELINDKVFQGVFEIYENYKNCKDFDNKKLIKNQKLKTILEYSTSQGSSPLRDVFSSDKKVWKFLELITALKSVE